MNRDIIMLGASTGGIEALGLVLAALPKDLPASVLIVHHLSPDSPMMLDGVLARSSALPVAFAAQGLVYKLGRVYLAPPDQHLLVDDKRLVLNRGPRENGFRPAIDTAFRSAAIAAGTRVIAGVMTGALDDGARGAAAVKLCGGKVVVQDPADALAPEMPMSTLQRVQADAVVTAAGFAEVLARLAREQAEPRPEIPKDVLLEAEAITMSAGARGVTSVGADAPAVCPECNGILSSIQGSSGEHYVCHTGHMYSPVSLLASQGREVERAMYAALRALQEQARLFERLANRDERAGLKLTEKRYRTRAAEILQEINLLRKVLQEHGALGSNVPGSSAEEAGLEEAKQRN